MSVNDPLEGSKKKKREKKKKRGGRNHPSCPEGGKGPRNCLLHFREAPNGERKRGQKKDAILSLAILGG